MTKTMTMWIVGTALAASLVAGCADGDAEASDATNSALGAVSAQSVLDELVANAPYVGTMRTQWGSAPVVLHVDERRIDLRVCSTELASCEDAPSAISEFTVSPNGSSGWGIAAETVDGYRLYPIGRQDGAPTIDLQTPAISVLIPRRAQR